MTESSHDPERYNVSMMDVERRLGFRVTRSGVERLAWKDDDPSTAGIPRAVQPVLNATDALAMYSTLVELVATLSLSRRDVKFWKDKAFEEAEKYRNLAESQKAERASMVPMDARSAKNSLGDRG